MGIIASILPGARDLRVSLTVGLLWCVSLWLAYPMLPDELTSSALVDRVVVGQNGLDRTLLIPLLSLGVYLLGVLLELVGRVLAIIWMILIAVAASMALVLFLIALAMFVVSQSRGVILVAPLAVVVWLVLPPTRRKQRLANLRMWLLLRWIGLASALSTSASVVLRILTPNYIARQEFMLERLDALVVGSRDVLGRFVKELSRTELQILAYRLQIEEELPNNFSGSTEEIHSTRELIRRNALNEAQVQALMECVIQCLAESAAARRILYLVYARLGQLRKATERELNRTKAVLRANYDRAFDEYDRLNSEADLRLGIATPTGAILALAILTITPGAGTTAFIGGVVPVILLSMLGTLRRESAQHLLLSYIQSGICPVDEQFFVRQAVVVQLRNYDAMRLERRRYGNWIVSRLLGISSRGTVAKPDTPNRRLVGVAVAADEGKVAT